MLIKYMLQFGIIKLFLKKLSEFLCLVTNHATDAMKAVVHAVNMKFRLTQHIILSGRIDE